MAAPEVSAHVALHEALERIYAATWAELLAEARKFVTLTHDSYDQGQSDYRALKLRTRLWWMAFLLEGYDPSRGCFFPPPVGHYTPPAEGHA